MEVHKYSERVDAVLGRSRRLEGFVACASVATAVLLAGLPMAFELQAAALAWTGVSALAALRRARPGKTLRVGLEGAIEVGGVRGVLRDGSFVAPWLVAIRWRPPGAWWDRSLLVAPGMLGNEEFRRLRVLLRFGDRPLGPLPPVA
jgi:hypothetical protein